jgi:hypothetical protein
MRSMPSKSKLNLDLAKGTACVVPASQRRSAHTHRFRACTRAAHRYRLRNVGYCCSNLAGGPTRQQFSVGWAWEKEILWNAENRGIKLRLREQEPSRRQCTLCSSPWSRPALCGTHVHGARKNINRDRVTRCAHTGRHGCRFRDGQIWRNILAKSTMRGNREVKKPKQPKKVMSPAGGVSPALAPKTTAGSAPAKKK